MKTLTMRGWTLLVAVGALACSTTDFKSTWRDPTARPVTLNGQRVAAFVVAPNESMRRSSEHPLPSIIGRSSSRTVAPGGRAPLA